MVGRARIIGDHIGGDQIISSAYLIGNIRLEELTAHAFESCRPDLGPALKAGDIIVAGENFGCGSSREYGILLLKSAGISCVIARSVARNGYRACINHGLLPVECTVSVDELEEISVDVEQGIVRTKNGRTAFSTYPEQILKIIREGGFINYYKKYRKIDF